MPFILECTLVDQYEIEVWNKLCKKYKYIIWKTLGESKISFRGKIERSLFEKELKDELSYLNCIHSSTKGT